MCAKRNGNSKDSFRIVEHTSKQALGQTEQYLQNIIENAPTGIVTLSIDGELLHVNPAYCEITGYYKEELEGMNYKSLTLDDDLAIDNYNIQQLLEGKVNAYKLEKRYIRKDNQIIWVQITRSLLRDCSTNNPLYFIAQVEDITARKESEKIILSNEAYLRNIVNHAPAGIVTVSLDGQLLSVNPAFCKITGFDKEELEHMNYKKLTYAEDLSIDTLRVQELLENKIDSYQLEKRYKRRDGKVIWVLIIRSLVRDIDTETPLYFIAQVEDITERKRTDKMLRESEERFRNIMDNAPVGITTVAIDGRFIQVNPAFCAITGYHQKELQTLTYQELTYHEDLPENIVKIQELLEGKIATYKMEKRYIRKDNKIIWVQVTRSILREQNTGAPLYFIAQVEDISERKLVEEKLRKSAEEIADLYENAPCGYHSLDADGLFIRMNNTELQWLGYSREEIINKKKLSDLLTPESQLVFQENSNQFNEQGLLSNLEVEMRRKDGSTFTVLLSATGNRAFGNRYAMNRSTMFNITDRKRTEKALQESEALLRTIMDNAPIGMAIQSLDGQLLQVNRALCEITSHKKEELEKLTLQDITYPDDLAKDTNNIQRLIEGKDRYYQIEKRICKSGTLSWVEVTRSLLRDINTGEPLYFIVQIQDINEQILNREKIRHLAYHDILTDLPNRQLLLEQLTKTLALAKRHKRIFALMFIDLDKFKNINDTLGHDVGDQLLKEVASRLNKSFRSSDIIARTGGDEFIVVLTDIKSLQDAAISADKIIKAIRQPITIRHQSMQIGASIGIVTYPENGSDITELMKKADSAMYTAKFSGGNKYHFY